MSLIQVTFFLYIIHHSSLVDDYWNEDYDDEKNCISELAIEKLKEMNLDEKQCDLNLGDDPFEALRECRYSLTSKAILACSMTKIKKAGDLLYCRNRGTTTCCFDNYECEKNWDDIENPFPQQAAIFLEKKEETVESIRKDNSFNTCHVIKGYDASKCAEDCKSIDSSLLAATCKMKKGLLKCCIRRDKQFCHECRYCCTLQFCSYMNTDGVLIHIGENDVLVGNMTMEITKKNKSDNALNYIYSRDNFLKRQDTRCLKPYSNDDPEKWEHYDPDDFANAVNEGQLSKARSVQFDKRFFNFEDPEVFNQMTGADYQQHMKETYGFDYVMRLIKLRGKYDNSQLIAKCSQNCIKAEHSKFANSCRRKGGLFKCCITKFGLSIFENVRKELNKLGKISEFHELCEEGDMSTGYCTLCTTSYFCSYWNRNTSSISHDYNTPDFNNVGGVNVWDGKKYQRFPLKTTWCMRPDFCTLMREEYYDTKRFLMALTRKEVCEIPSSPLISVFNQEIQGLLESKEDCLKRSSNVRICPSDVIETQHVGDKVKLLNNQLIKTKRKLRGHKIKKKKRKKSKKKLRKKFKKAKKRKHKKKMKKKRHYRKVD